MPAVIIDTTIVEVGESWRVWVESAGPAEGVPLLVHASHPGSRRLFAPSVQHAARHGFRLISYDRPGFGDSPPRAGRRVADSAIEVRAIADHFRIGRLGVWGFSGGGPFALASAALLPDLVAGCCVFASLAPYDADGLDFTGDWSDAHRQEVELFFDQPTMAREHFRVEAAEMFAVLGTAQGWLDRWGDAAETDMAHSRKLAEHLAAEQRDCLAGGDDGWWDDWVAFLTPWGFDPAAIAVPVQLWHGEHDTSAPPAHGHWLADRIPLVDAHFPDNDDHTNIEANHEDAAYSWLRRRLP
jgi:pimeloyl-ACP methyl ester carboxylesterase